MKYILFEDFADKAVPIIFPDRINHDELREQIPYARVLSAGYIKFANGSFSCYGESKSLGAKAAPGDGELIAKLLAQPDE